METDKQQPHVFDFRLDTQLKEISRLNREMAKIIKGSKTVYNKDRYTFMQAFRSRCTEKGLLPYLEDIVGDNVRWEDLTAASLERFVNYLCNTKTKRTGKSIQPTTQNLYIAHLRALIKWGNTPINDTMSILKAHKCAPRKKVWLHPDEIEKIYNYDFKNYEASTWRYFLICCLLGCRLSDSLEISIDNLDGNTIRYRPIKTRNIECYVRLRPEQITVLQRLFSVPFYGFMPTNERLRQMLHNVPYFSRKFDIGTYGCQNVVDIADVIHFHSARHSFATIKYRYSDYTDREIALAVGHTDFKQTWNYYICDKSPVTQEEKGTKGLFI